jgi:hypothetical protein
MRRAGPRGSGEGGWVVRLVFCRPSLGKVGGGQIDRDESISVL